MSIPGFARRGIGRGGPLVVGGVGRNGITDIKNGRGGRGALGKGIFKSIPMFSTAAYKITGTTKDSTGAALGNCVVDLFYTVGDILAAKVESDASGAFSFSIGPALRCYIVAYKAGSPDVAGTSVNTLVGV